MVGQHVRSIRLATVIAIGLTLLAAPAASAADEIGGQTARSNATGALVAFSGSVRSTYDADTFVTTSLSYDGTFIDLCAELSD